MDEQQETRSNRLGESRNEKVHRIERHLMLQMWCFCAEESKRKTRTWSKRRNSKDCKLIFAQGLIFAKLKSTKLAASWFPQLRNWGGGILWSFQYMQGRIDIFRTILYENRRSSDIGSSYKCNIHNRSATMQELSLFWH